jgi:hypothetical protein
LLKILREQPEKSEQLLWKARLSIRRAVKVAYLLTTAGFNGEHNWSKYKYAAI